MISETYTLKYLGKGTSLVVQGKRVRAPNAEGPGLIPGWETKVPQATRHGQKNKKKNTED